MLWVLVDFFHKLIRSPWGRVQCSKLRLTGASGREKPVFGTIVVPLLLCQSGLKNEAGRLAPCFAALCRKLGGYRWVHFWRVNLCNFKNYKKFDLFSLFRPFMLFQTTRTQNVEFELILTSQFLHKNIVRLNVGSH
jgi:hypothetical protein